MKLPNHIHIIGICGVAMSAVAIAFKEKGVKFEEREVRGNEAYFKELVAKSGQSKTPTMDLDGEITADSDREQIAAVLKAKGYPGF